MALPYRGGSVVLLALALLLLFSKTRTAICCIPLRQGNFLPHGIGVLHLMDSNVHRTFPSYEIDLAWSVDARY